MKIRFTSVDLAQDYDFCVYARKDTYLCSFHSDSGFEGFLAGYRDRILERLAQKEWFYIHVWQDKKIVGQLEFRTVSSEPDTGYVHLIYLIPECRGSGMAQKLHDYIRCELRLAGCKRAVLSVSRTNLRALRFYEHHGWEYYRANPKHDATDFYQLWLHASLAL